MNIIEAAKHLREGKRIRRKCWGDKTSLCVFFVRANHSLMISSRTSDSEWDILINEAEADDWEIVE